VRRLLFLVLLACCAHAPFDARTQQLASLGGKSEVLAIPGRVVLLDFWATWCEPCRAASSYYGELQSELGPRGLTVVAVSIDDDPTLVRAALARVPARRFVELIDPHGAVAEQLGATLMPTAVLLDRAGKVRFKHDGFERKDRAQIRAEILQLLQ